MLIKQFARFLKYEYSKGSPYFCHINDALKYYYEKYDKQEINRNRILLSQFSTNQKYSRMSLYSDCDFELAMILWDKNSASFCFFFFPASIIQDICRLHQDSLSTESVMQ